MKEMRELAIRITPSSIIVAILLVLLVALLYILRDLVLIVLTAIVIASAIEPATAWFQKYKIPRLVSVLIVYLTFFALLLGFFYFFLPTILVETLNFLAILPSYLQAIDNLNPFQETVFLGTEGLADQISFSQAFESLRGVFSNVTKSFLETINFVFGGLLSFVLIIVFSFYFAVQETGIDDFLRVISPAKHQKYIVNLWKRSQVKIGLWMQGQLMLAVIVGMLVYLGLTILGVKHALLLALVAAIFELIPVFGPILSAIPAIAVGFVDGGVTVGLLVVGLYVIIQQFENHLIYPLVVTKVVGVPPLLVILALLVGAQLAGFLGIILSVPFAAVLQELVSDIQKNKKRQLAEVEGAT